MEFESLKLLGLNSYEIKAYLVLLEKGENKASFVSKHSKIPSSKIYETLASLEQKGLVYTIPKDVKEFGAKPVQVMKTLLEKQKEKLSEIDKKLKKLEAMPQRNAEGNIIVVEGKRGFEELIKNLPKVGSPFAYNIMCKADTNPTHLRNLKNAVKTGRNLKALVDTKAPNKNVKIMKKYNPNIKQINAPGIAMEITDKTSLISILETNKTIFIESKDFALTMKQLFEAYYENN